MTIATQNPLLLEDINFNEPGGPVRFANPSDTIFASLFLPVSSNEDGSKGLTSVPWQLCDRILSVIRSPQFDSKEVTFKSCGDMFRCVGNRRDEVWSAVEARSACSSSFPEVVLDGVLDLLRAEITSLAPVERRDFFKNLGRSPTHPAWKSNLQNMMHVHSSWHAKVKRLLGYRVSSTQGPTPTVIHNPLFGVWTNEVCLSYHDYEAEDTYEDYRVRSEIRSLGSGHPHAYLLSTLCARIPNTRLAHLYLADLPGDYMEAICNALSSLKSLEELVLEAAPLCRDFELQKVIAAISKTPLPALRALRFYADYFPLESDDPHDDPLQPLERLKTIHVVQFHFTQSFRERDPFFTDRISSFFLSRSPTECGAPSPFVTSDLQIECISEPDLRRRRFPQSQSINGGFVKMAEMAKLVRMHVADKPYRLPIEPFAPSKLNRILADRLLQCPSARTIVLHGFPWTRMDISGEFRENLVTLEHAEELVIESASFPHPPQSNSWSCATEEEKVAAKTNFSVSDAGLSQIIYDGLFPNLRTLRLTFPKESLEYYSERFKDAHESDCLTIEERRLLLAHCRQTCSEMNIQFHVDIV